MSQLYLRNVVVQIGDESGNLNIKIPNDFKIAFDIQKLIGSNSAEGTVTIYNLSNQTKTLIKDRGTRIRIFAGYQNDVALLHDGQIIYVEPIDQGADRLIIVHVANVLSNMQNAIFSKSYQNQVKVKQIVSDAVTTYNIPFSQDIFNVIPDDETLSNYVFHGPTMIAVDQLLQPLNLQLFERNRQLFISKQSEPLTNQQDDVIVLNSTTGLIKTAVRTDKGVNATALLNPRLQAGSIVQINNDVTQNAREPTYRKIDKDTEVRGLYKVIQANYRGDNWDGQFEVLIQCVEYGINNSSSNNDGNTSS